MKATHFIISIYEVAMIERKFKELEGKEDIQSSINIAKLTGQLELLKDAKQIAYTPEIDLADNLFEQIAELTRPTTGNDLTKIDEP